MNSIKRVKNGLALLTVAILLLVIFIIYISKNTKEPQKTLPSEYEAVLDLTKSNGEYAVTKNIEDGKYYISIYKYNLDTKEKVLKELNLNEDQVIWDIPGILIRTPP